MKKCTLLILTTFIVGFAQSQVQTRLKQSPNKAVSTFKEKGIQKALPKAVGDVIWSEDFNGSKWTSTVISDGNGYVLNTSATLPEGWVISESWGGATANPNYGHFHWSDVGPRGVYINEDGDNNPFTPDQSTVNLLPSASSVLNGFMMLESDFSNTTEIGNMTVEPKEMDSYIQYGPLDFSSYAGIIFNLKTIYRYCCSTDASFTLELSSNYDPTEGSGNWSIVPLNVLTKGNEYTHTSERDFHSNVSNYVAGESAVYFRLHQTYSSHYFWIIDDVMFYEAPVNDIKLTDAWADYLYDATELEYSVNNNPSLNFWGGYTEIPQNIVGPFVKFRAAVEANGTAEATNVKLITNINLDWSTLEILESEPKTVEAFSQDTLFIETNFTPYNLGLYQVSMTVVMDEPDEFPFDNSWNYEFKVTNSNRYSRVRHGMESIFGQAGNRDWANGGNDGDACINEFYFPSSLETVRLEGISVYIDNYTGRYNEIEAIKNGQFSMIARIWKYDAEYDEITDMGIASNLYTLNIEDTATWVTLNFIDEGNLVVETDKYYAGIEIYTGNQDLRFQIGEDANAPKQPKGGGLVYLAFNNDWYTTNDNYAIDLLINNEVVEFADVTFNVDLNYSTDFNPEEDEIYITGTISAWEEPGINENFRMTDEDGDGIYSIVIQSEVGTIIEYKYFKNAGWDGGEWGGNPNRIISINNPSSVYNDIFGELKRTANVEGKTFDITIDGDASEWTDIAPVNINKIFRSESPTLTSATWKAVWNEEGLYIAVEVEDDYWFPSWISGNADWNSDKIELYIDASDPQQDGNGAASQNGNWQIAPDFSETEPGIAHEFEDLGFAGLGIIYANTYDTEGNYTQEYFIPWNAIPNQESMAIDPFTSSIGFDVTIIDRDASDADGGSRNRMVWNNNGNIDESWVNMDDVGLITFTGAPHNCEYFDTISNEEAICLGDYFDFRGTIIFNEGHYESYDYDACTLYELDLTVNNTYYKKLPATIYAGESFNGLTTSGIHNLNLTSITGCDSILEVYLSVLGSIPVSILPAGETIVTYDSIITHKIETTYESILVYDTLATYDSIFIKDSIFVQNTNPIQNQILVSVVDGLNTIVSQEINGSIYLKLDSDVSDLFISIQASNLIKSVKLLDSGNNEILKENIGDVNASVNLSSFIKGTYTVIITNQYGTFNKIMVIE